MKALHRNWSELFNDCMIIMIAAGTIGIALKFTTFFDKWVYFPSFPNICDSAFLVLSVAYLSWKAKRTHTTKQTNPLSKMGQWSFKKTELPNSSKAQDDAGNL
jgi:cytochrome c oxidase assembly factor CtaG